VEDLLDPELVEHDDLITYCGMTEVEASWFFAAVDDAVAGVFTQSDAGHGGEEEHDECATVTLSLAEEELIELEHDLTAEMQDIEKQRRHVKKKRAKCKAEVSGIFVSSFVFRQALGLVLLQRCVNGAANGACPT